MKPTKGKIKKVKAWAALSTIRRGHPFVGLSFELPEHDCMNIYVPCTITYKRPK